MVIGTSPPESPVIGNVQNLLRDYFGFDEFRPGQAEVIENLVSGRSAAAVFPTGGGKSLCYQLPALALDGVTLVVSPLIALMKDQIDTLDQRGIAAARLDSSLSADEYREVMRQIRDGELRLLYVAPERFNNERFRELIKGLTVSLFAVDEAHCISEWGHNFRPDYLKLARFATECGAERILALTATAPPKVLDDICREFQIDEQCAHRTTFYRSNLTLLSSPVTADDRDAMLLARLRERPEGSTIIYATLQKTTENVATFLTSHGLSARAYHAGMKPDERHAIQEWFLQSDETREEGPVNDSNSVNQSDSVNEGRIIVATIAFGMGIDKSNIRYVYHYNMAKSLENYAQEIGRAGRDGEPSICETLVCLDDLRTLENFVYGDTPTESAVQTLLADLFSRGQDFGVSIYHLAREHDIRNLVLRTLLTYLELDGYLEGGTPYYCDYQFHPLRPSTEILGHFEGARRDFLAGLFRHAQKSGKWFTVDIDGAASALQSDRQRIVRALDYLAEQNWMEVKVAGVHHRYRLLRRPESSDALATELHQRALGREGREIDRLQSVLRLMRHDDCRVSALGSYFGEPLPQPCGHCSWCLEGGLPMETAAPCEQPCEQPIDQQLWQQAVALRADSDEVLRQPVPFARFLCGVTSPQLSRAKLSRHPLFGALASASFSTVLARCRELS